MPRGRRSATLGRRGRSATRSAPEEEGALPTATSQPRVDPNLPILNVSSASSSAAGSNLTPQNQNIDIHSTAGSSVGDEPAVLGKGTSPGYKLALSIIPEYDGENMPVSMFIEHCRAAAEAIEAHEIKYLILYIRTKVTKDARKHVWGKTFDTLDSLLRQLERSAHSTDSTQLMLKLSSTTRNPGETIADYGSRTLDLVTEISKCLEQEYPGGVGKSMALGTKQAAIKHFLRGLDEQTLSRMIGREPKDLDEAIDFARKADVEAECWRSLHGGKTNRTLTSSEHFLSDKVRSVGKGRVAHLQSNKETPRGSRGKSLSSTQCFNCKEYGHVKRDCPDLHKGKGKRSGSALFCNYCTFDGHVEEECFLKRKHDKEREERIARKGQGKQGHLNSKGSRRSDAATVQVYQKRSGTDTSSTSATTTEPKSQ